MHKHLKQILKHWHQANSNFLVLTGPTCTGKTALSLELAQELSLPIINADSRLIFDEMNIGTAKPSPEELKMATHHLIDIKKANEFYSAGDYQKDFDLIVNKLDKAIVAGGTGLYIDAALGNLSLSKIDSDAKIREELSEKNLVELQIQLNKLDPQAHELIDTKNKIRLIRAIEMMLISQKPLSELRRTTVEPRHQAIYFALNFQDREKLYMLINKRVEIMIENGLVDEAKYLLDKYGETQTLTSTIGYKEIIGYLNKAFDLEQAKNLIQQKTRNYAKRQITCFKKNPQINWLYND
jgi:tRNA dimethylallyltransferase